MCDKKRYILTRQKFVVCRLLVLKKIRWEYLGRTKWINFKKKLQNQYRKLPYPEGAILKVIVKF